jgi:peptidoglycan/LPS O-acetylase OafA/YrhL
MQRDNSTDMQSMLQIKKADRMQHISALDGVRAIAVGLVMLFHFGYLAIGWVGVQVFFVLSGYLITSILLQTKNKPFTDYIVAFYWNRALRILPLLFAFISISAVAYAFFGVPGTFKADWPWLITFSANFARMRPEDLGFPFVHIWSLAVEQQFYLVWPLVVFFVPPKRFKFVVLAILVVTPLVRLALFELLTHRGFDEQFAGKAVYVLPIAQFDAFAAGAAIPLWSLDRLAHSGRWFLSITAVTAAAGFTILVSEYFGGRGAFVASFGYAMYLLPGREYVWGYSLLNVVFVLGLICALQAIWPTRVLQAKSLVWMGKISYGIYVYHLPLLILGGFIFTKMGMDIHGPLRFVYFVTWVLTVAVVSDQSFRWLETPFLKLKKRTKVELRTPSPMTAEKALHP